MFCPSCGSEERQASQFCRACGTDLHVVRISLERPDSITASAMTAREEIGRAVAEKIREMEDARYMRRFAQYVLPKIDKFLESPEEKRLRRLRSGTIAALIGFFLGFPALWFLSVTHNDDAQIFLGWVSIIALITLATGLGLLINGLLFSKPRKEVEDRSSAARAQNLLDSSNVRRSSRSANEAHSSLRSPTTSSLVQPPNSVTEHPTLHLESDR